jgi:hypothetical protein
VVRISTGDATISPWHQCKSLIAHDRVGAAQMTDWEDVRYFLAVARKGSVRAAAERLEVTHSTVLRRITQFEVRLGAQMFEKLP